MGKLWIFGDSFSTPFTNPSVSGFGEPYIKHKGYVPFIFSDIVSKNLKMTHMNCAHGGSDNYTIFESICDKQHLISDEDLIIVGWSHHNRYRIINQQLNWSIVRIDFEDNEQSVLRNESKVTLREIELWGSLLRRTFKNQIIFWSPFNLDISEVINPKDYINTFDITEETNGQLIDFHYSETTHFELADLLIKFLPDITNKRELI